MIKCVGFKGITIVWKLQNTTVSTVCIWIRSKFGVWSFFLNFQFWPIWISFSIFCKNCFILWNFNLLWPENVNNSILPNNIKVPIIEKPKPSVNTMICGNYITWIGWFFPSFILNIVVGPQIRYQFHDHFVETWNQVKRDYNCQDKNIFTVVFIMILSKSILPVTNFFLNRKFLPNLINKKYEHCVEEEDWNWSNKPNRITACY